LKVFLCQRVIVTFHYQHADDLVVMISKQSDVQVLFEILGDFKALSSANVNWNNSEALLIGSWGSGKPQLPSGLQWGREGFRYLGFFLGGETVVQKNWEGLIEKVKGRLDKWKFLAPKLSYRGRILIVNMLTTWWCLPYGIGSLV